MEDKTTKKVIKSMQGVVLRKSGDMSVIVEVSTEERHKLYGKKMKRSKRFLVHDSANAATIGETVSIKECRPYSKRKRWTLVERKTSSEKLKTTTQNSKESSLEATP